MADHGAAADEIAELDARFTPPPAAWQEMWAEVRHRLDIRSNALVRAVRMARSGTSVKSAICC